MGADAGVAGNAPLSVTNISYASQIVVRGESKALTGRTTQDAVAVGVRLADFGTGYWVIPVDVRDQLYPGELTYKLTADFSPGIPAGIHALRFVAIGSGGAAGEQADLQLCFGSGVPDNNHTCDPTKPAPAVVFSLQWDADFDVDLHVVTPAGVDINPKAPIGNPVDGGMPPATLPRVDRDSLGSCVPDGIRAENLVFQKYPALGVYDVYADPFSPCKAAAARFVLTIYEVGDDGDLHPTYTRAGELLAQQATGGGSAGLFVAEKNFE
jgi:hypothetical protein